MLSALLRSGDIKEYTALGQDGQAVYLVAPQLRDTIRIKRGKRFSDFLAIPQRNEQGGKIDWYVPFESELPDGEYQIIPWTSATEEEQKDALSRLDEFEKNMLDLGSEMARSSNLKGDQLVFARLLYSDTDSSNNLKALRFPNHEHVYIVNGRPVITFWGFVEKNRAVMGSPFLGLHQELNTSPPPAPPPPIEPVMAAPVVESKPRRFWWLWLLLLLLLLALLGWFFRNDLTALWYKYFPNSAPPAITAPAENKTPSTTSSPKGGLGLGSLFGFTNKNSGDKPEPKIEEKPVLKTEDKPVAVVKCEPQTYYRNNNIVFDINGKAVEEKALKECDIVKVVSELVRDNVQLPYRWLNDKWVDLNGRAVTDPKLLGLLDHLKEASFAKATLPMGVATGKPEADPTKPVLDSKLNEASNRTEVSTPADMNKPETSAKPEETTKPAENTATTNITKPVDPNLTTAGVVPGSTDSNVMAVPGTNTTVSTNTVPGTAPATTPLALSTEDVQQGKTQVLDGGWSVNAGLQDKVSGKPLRLSYDFKNGAGQVILERNDGVKCVGNVQASMVNNGLSIKNTSQAQCPDGQFYKMPDVTCKPSTGGASECVGQYDSGNSFPISIKSGK